MLQKNITKTYKKVSHTATSSIEHETKSIKQKLNLDDRVRTTAEKDAFITLKDHKPNFDNNPTCRLINPTKSEIGKISKQDDERHIITHAKKSFLFSSGEQWCKKPSSNLFYITMGSDDGAETCELLGCFLLHQITTKHGNNFGLYRDDGLGISSKSPREVELIEKDLCAIFRKHGLKITIVANKKCVDFLDVTLKW